MYQLRQIDGSSIALTTGKVVCVGRNYVDHIQELNNETPSEPLLFIKPATALVDVTQPFHIPSDKGECQNELELAVLINKTLKQANKKQVFESIWGVGLGLDLTLRDVQNELKAKGLPWERAKSFDGACPMSPFIPIADIADIQDLNFTLLVDNNVRQQGHTSKMIWQVGQLIEQISQVFTLTPGDIVMTGTPKGVGPLVSGQKLTLELDNRLCLQTQVL